MQISGKISQNQPKKGNVNLCKFRAVFYKSNIDFSCV